MRLIILVVLAVIVGCTELDRQMIDHSKKLREEWTKRGVPLGASNPVPPPFMKTSELDGLRALNEWPKHCGTCGKTFTAEEWSKLPIPDSGQSCSEDSYAKWAWRLCDGRVPDSKGGTERCGSTMMAVTYIKDESQY